MSLVRILSLLLFIFSILGLIGIIFDRQLVPIAINYIVIFFLSLTIAILASNVKYKN